MKDTEKMTKVKSKETKSLDDILSFDYYNYRLEVLAKKIKSGNFKNRIKA